MSLCPGVTGGPAISGFSHAEVGCVLLGASCFWPWWAPRSPLRPSMPSCCDVAVGSACGPLASPTGFGGARIAHGRHQCSGSRGCLFSMKVSAFSAGVCRRAACARSRAAQATVLTMLGTPSRSSTGEPRRAARPVQTRLPAGFERRPVEFQGEAGAHDPRGVICGTEGVGRPVFGVQHRLAFGEVGREVGAFS